MRDAANLKTKGFNKSVLSGFVSALKEKGMNVNSEWMKMGLLTAKKSSPEKANILKVTYKGKDLLLFQDDGLGIRLDNLDDQGERILVRELKERELIKKSSFLFGAIASFVHLLLLLALGVLGLSMGDAFVIGLAGFSLFFIFLGLIGLYFSTSSSNTPMKIVSLLIFLLGAFLTLPSSLLHLLLVQAILRKASEKRLGL